MVWCAEYILIYCVSFCPSAGSKWSCKPFDKGKEEEEEENRTNMRRVM